MSTRTLALAVAVLAACLSAAKAEVPIDTDVSYAPRFVCGAVDERFQEGLVTGSYETHIVIVNPSMEPVRFQKTPVRALPFQRGEPAAATVLDTVPAASAIAIECNELRMMMPGSMSAEFRSGVLKIEAEASLDIDVTYSARGRGANISSIDREAVPERRHECPSGVGGPDCSIDCMGESTCGVDLFYNANGSVNGVIARGTLLTATNNALDDVAVLADYRQWVRTHAGLLGLEPLGGEPMDHIAPSGRPLTQDGALVTHRFTQSYRGFPVVGPEELISVTAGDFRGILSVSGTVLDPRVDYAGLDSPMPEALAQQSMRDWFLDLTGSFAPPSSVELENFRFVAVPQRATMGYAADLAMGGFGMGSILINASVNDGGRAPLLSFSGLREHPEDEQQSTIRVENMAEAADYARFGQPVDEVITDELVNVSPIAGQRHFGSVYQPDACIGDPSLPECGQIRLGNRAVVAIDANGMPLSGAGASLGPVLSPTGQFTAAQGTSRFGVQDQYFKLLNALRVLDSDTLNRGLWETETPNSSFPDGTYSPRLLMIGNAPNSACPDQAACAGVFSHVPDGTAFDIPPHEPPGGGSPEPYGLVYVEADVRTVMFHEFGHTLDSMTARGIIGRDVVGSGCPANGPCVASCEIDTPDEAEALAETTADMMQLFLIDRLYPQIPYEQCNVIAGVSNGDMRFVHHPACIDSPNDVLHFEQTRPRDPGYDEVRPDVFEPTGVCAYNPGYRQDPVYQAWWKIINNQHCLASGDLTCSTAVPSLTATEMSDIAMQAYLFAMRQSNAQSYKMFFSNMALFVDCRYGEEVGPYIRETLELHGLIDAGGEPLVCPAICGDGVAEDAEQCDAPDLAGASCTSVGGGFTGGALGCTAQCTFDTSVCTTCGNGIVEAGEQCDGAAFDGESCVSQGFDGGALTCSASCTIGTALCTNDPTPPEECDPGTEDCVCVPTFGSFGTENAHPDGDHSINQFCPDDGDTERTCVSQGGFGLCTTCSEGNDRHVGCSCASDAQCGAGLSCWGEDTQGGAGTGRCYAEDTGPPSWQCIADCQTLFNSDSAYCHNDHPSGEALCSDGACNGPQAFQCWTEGLLEGIDEEDQPTFGPMCRFAPDDTPLSASCRSECGPGADFDNPGLDVTCQDLGYPDAYQCDLQVAGGTCRRGPL